MLLDFDDDETQVEECRPAMRICGSLCTFLSVSACFVIIILLLAFIVMGLTQTIHVVYIGGPIQVETSEKFLSIALDSSLIANGFKHFDFANPRIIKAMKALSPAYLRIGGTMADRLIFTVSNTTHFKHHFQKELDGGDCSYEYKFCDYLEKPKFTMDSQEWLKLNKLAKDTNLTLLFDLNVLLRFSNGSWDYRNAEKLIDFSAKHDLDLNWELGNEPNSFRRQFDREIDPEQLAKDFHVLKGILGGYPKYARSLLVGPDVTRPQIGHNESMIYLKRFLESGRSAIDAITWHQYYFNGATASIGDFLNPQVFDILKWQIARVKDITKNSNKPIWLGETSSAYGGGAPHLSNRYIASFLWLDKLGIAAKYGLDVVIRQSIFQGYYALLNHKYYPSPDWWVSILYKKLVGNKVIDCHMQQSSTLRLYCHCTKRYYSNITSVTVFGINLNNQKAKIRFEGVFPLSSKDAKNLMVDAYVLTTVEKIDSRYIYLNRNLLTLTATGDVPKLSPKRIKANPYVIIPAYSMAFWVVPAKNLVPC